MKRNRWMVFSLIALMVVSLTACGTMSSREQKGTGAGVLIGAAAGAGLGQAIGRDTEATLWGAAAGAVLGGIAGNRIAAYMDRQEQDLRRAMAQSEGIAISRDQDVLTASFKSNMMFDFDSAVLKPGAYAEIDRVARVLNQYNQTMIRVEGHTDAAGSEEYNQRLSERRADAVKLALAQRNVDPRRIQTLGYGESMPISSDPAANRRVDIVIIPVEAQG